MAVTDTKPLCGHLYLLLAVGSAEELSQTLSLCAGICRTYAPSSQTRSLCAGFSSPSYTPRHSKSSEHYSTIEKFLSSRRSPYTEPPLSEDRGGPYAGGVGVLFRS